MAVPAVPPGEGRGGDGAARAGHPPAGDPGRHEQGFVWPVEAELAAGPVGPPSRSLLRRVARITAGTFLLAVGALLLVLPGPGWLIIAAGLALLSRDVPWADRLLRRVRRRIPGARPDGGLTLTAWISIAGVTATTVGVSIWFALR